MARTEHPIFEQTISKLYYSNDLRLHVMKVPSPDSYKEDGSLVALPAYVYQVICLPENEAAYNDGKRGETVFVSYDPVKADAFIAGYDLARREA